jgi:ribose 5-phosphate isomerase A
MQARDAAARAAVGEVQDGMLVGLGTGDTAERAIRALAGRQIVCVATSRRSAELAEKLGLTTRSADEVSALDLTIDGADEIDPSLRLIKGAGGALTREKIVARASKRLIIVADEGKLVGALGEKHRLPVELLPFGRRWTLERLAALGLDPVVREGFVSDNGGLIADCRVVGDVAELARNLDAIAGVVEHGLFLDEAAAAYVGRADGSVATIERPLPGARR